MELMEEYYFFIKSIFFDPTGRKKKNKIDEVLFMITIIERIY